MLPFLHFLSDSKEHSLREAEESLGKYFKLSDAERAELLPSGQQGIFKNRIGWARTYLKKACLIESPKRGVFKITDRGLNILSTNPIRIDAKFLEQFPEFMEFKDISKTTNGITSTSVPAAAILAATTTPEEAIELAYQGLREQLAQELLSVILSCSPIFFEQLVVDLLVHWANGRWGHRRNHQGRSSWPRRYFYSGETLARVGRTSRNSKVRWGTSRPACKEGRFYHYLDVHSRCD